MRIISFLTVCVHRYTDCDLEGEGVCVILEGCTTVPSPSLTYRLLEGLLRGTQNVP